MEKLVRESWIARFFLMLALAVAVCAFSMLLSQPVRFFANDDMTMQHILSGEMFGYPSAHVVYVNILVSYPVMWLYELMPDIPWWLAINELGTSLSMALILFSWPAFRQTPSPSRSETSGIGGRNAFNGPLGYAKLGKHGKHGVSAKSSVLLRATAAIVLSCLFAYFFARPSFTYTATALAAAAVALAQAATQHDLKTGGGELRFILVSLALALIGAFCMRSEPGLIGLAISLAIAGLSLIKHLRENRRSPTLQRPPKAASRKAIGVPIKLAGSLALSCLLVGSAYAVNEAAYSSSEWQEFSSENHARSLFLDFPHDSYKQNPELYESIGWDISCYQLANSWTSLDNRVNEETYLYIYENSQTPKSIDLIDAFQEVSSAFSDMNFNGLLAFTALLLLAEIGLARKHEDWILLVFLAAVIIGCMFYLAYIGRFIGRAMLAGLLPVEVLLVHFVLAKTKQETPPRKQLTS